MRRFLTTAFAVFSVILLLAAITLTVFFGWHTSLSDGVLALVGVVISFALVPTFHELGHVWFAAIGGMKWVEVKIFCLYFYRRGKKVRVAFCSPFSPDYTQVVPTKGGDMLNRARSYTQGGNVSTLALFLTVSTCAILLGCFGIQAFALWGILPYAGYLLLINAVPLEYPNGKTDMLVARGLKKGYPAERNMLAAMEIQGMLGEGKSFSEIDENLYFDVPQLPEDEPLYAVMLDLQYRYYLEKNEFERAADRLNRLASSQAYLSDTEVKKVLAELVYMHALNGDRERAGDCAKACENYLQSESAEAKRALAAYCLAFGKTDAVEPLLAQAEELLASELLVGKAKAERILLDRIKTQNFGNSKA